MDREELDAALWSGDIDRETYDFALAACEKLYTWLSVHKTEIVDYVTWVYTEMR